MHLSRCFVFLFVAGLACGPRYGTITHGVAAGDVIDAAGDFTGKVTIGGLAPHENYRYTVWFDTGPFAGWRNAAAPEDATWIARGSFRTAPPANFPAPVRFAFGGDIAGQNVCRDRELGFPIVRVLRDRAARVPVTQSKKSIGYDFFIGLGDMIYADNRCEEAGMYGNRPGGLLRVESHFITAGRNRPHLS